MSSKGLFSLISLPPLSLFFFFLPVFSWVSLSAFASTLMAHSRGVSNWSFLPLWPPRRGKWRRGRTAKTAEGQTGDMRSLSSVQDVELMMGGEWVSAASRCQARGAAGHSSYTWQSWPGVGEAGMPLPTGPATPCRALCKITYGSLVHKVLRISGW